MALMLCSTLFISCSNNDSDDEIQTLIDEQEKRADGGDGTEVSPPVDPGDD